MSLSIKRSALAVVLSALSLGILGAPRSADALEMVDPTQCKGNHESGIVCGDGSGGGGGADYGPSEFLGAFANERDPGGWVEFYNDKGGDWSIEHHKDGSITVKSDNKGFATPIGGLTGEGQLRHKPRPKPKGAVVPATMPSFLQTKAAANVATGSFDHVHVVTPTVDFDARVPGSPTAKMNVIGTGTCRALLVVSSKGVPVSTTAVNLSLPIENMEVALPRSQGGYAVDLVGKNGCMTSSYHMGVYVKLTAIKIQLR